MRDGDRPTTSLTQNARRRGFLSYQPPSLARNTTQRGSFALQPAPSSPSLEVQHRGVFPPSTESATTSSLARNVRWRRFLATTTLRLAHPPLSFETHHHHPSLTRTQDGGVSCPPQPLLITPATPVSSDGGETLPPPPLPRSKHKTEGFPTHSTPLTRFLSDRGVATS